MKALWTPIDGCFQAHSRIMMTVMMQQPQLYIQLFCITFWNINSSVWAIWAVLAVVRGKKVDLSFSEQLLRVFFSIFCGQKKTLIFF